MMAITKDPVWKLVRSAIVIKYVGIKASHRTHRVYMVRLINLASLKFCGTFRVRNAKYVVTTRSSRLYARVTDSPIKGFSLQSNCVVKSSYRKIVLGCLQALMVPD